MSRRKPLWGRHTLQATQFACTAMQTGPKQRLRVPISRLGRPSWCNMAAHGFINDHPTRAQGPPGLSGVTRKALFFQPTHAGLKTAESSLVGAWLILEEHKPSNLLLLHSLLFHTPPLYTVQHVPWGLFFLF